MIDPTTFDLSGYLLDLEAQFGDLSKTDVRQIACCVDPLAFALIYLPHLLKQEDGTISFAECHFEWVELAKGWMDQEPSRDAFIAPRSVGKSTWWFLILPIWGAAFGHIRYVAAFAAAAEQAQGHLQNFKRELATNLLLKKDFPDLCRLELHPSTSRAVADNESRRISRNGFVFDADGVDKNVAGKNVAGKRPDLLILDDIEPDESNYTAYLVGKRLTTVLDNILYLNIAARVVFSGTTTMPGSIMHQLTQSLVDEPEQWIKEMRPKVRVHHALPIIKNDNGTERSIWERKWPLSFLQEIRNTKSYAKNFLNSPMSGDGEFWTQEDIKVEHLDSIGSMILSLDPAGTSTRTSDFTGIAVIGVSRKAKRYSVIHCSQVKLSPEPLRQEILRLLDLYPDIRLVYAERNTGQDYMVHTLLTGLPVKSKTIHQGLHKKDRAAVAAAMYQRGLVVHDRKFPALEEQMASYPKAPHDDMVDAVATGLNYLHDLARKRRAAQANRFTVQEVSYV